MENNAKMWTLEVLKKKIKFLKILKKWKNQNSWKYWKNAKNKIFLKILKKWKNGRFGKTWKIVNVGDLRKNQIYVKIESFVKI